MPEVHAPVNVLLAEDNPVNQEITVGLLETLDCTVTVVETGLEAVETAKNGAFDLVLMDCQMPIMDGFDATRAIRAAMIDDKRLPIVALTANDVAGTQADCVAAGMDDFLGKPFSRQDLQAMLQRWRGPSSPLQQPPADAAPSTSSLDLTPIDALRALDPAGERRLVQRAIAKFVDYSEELVTRLAEGVRTGDVDEVSRITHSLKSSSANLGAADLARRCTEIEKLTADGALPDDIDRRLSGLQAAHRTAAQDLLKLDET